MIASREVARTQGARIYKIEAEAQNLSGFGGNGFDPLEAILSIEPTPTTRYLIDSFRGKDAPVGPSSFRVACHVVSLDDSLWVIDSTFRTTAPEIFPGELERLVETEGHRLGSRPLHVIYTHAHFDHAGGHESVEALAPIRH